jgi:hypothetical protein
MLDTFKTLLQRQFEAAFCTIYICIDRCPDEAWDAPVGNLAFCQVVFHTLFFADFYLCESDEAIRQQRFHRDNAEFFRDYEEFQPRKQQLLYDRPGILRYLEHCRRKANDVVAAETEATLQGPSGFARRDCTRAEVHVYNIRHIQHHAAQLSLRLRLDFGEDIPWVSHGWRNDLIARS